MKQQARKLLAVVAIFSMLFGTAWMLNGIAVSAQSSMETLLQEDFSAGTDPEGWSFAGSSHSYQDGWLVTKTGMPYYAPAEEWSNYTYSAKMKLMPVENPTATAKQYYGVRFAIDTTANKGVEFCLIYNPTNGGYTWRAYDRKTGSSIVTERALTGVTAAAGQELTLQVKVEDKTATFLINGVQQAQGTATRTLTGGIGTYTSGNTYAVAWFDDILVQKEKTESADDTTLLLDTFTGKSGDLPTENADWIRTGAVRYDSDELYLRTAGSARYTAESAAAWGMYSFTASMTFTGEGAGPDGTQWNGNAAYSGITVGMTGSTGIEFDVVYTSEGFKTRLYDRTNGSILVNITPLSADLGLAVGEPMLLRVDYTPTRIKGYINGNEVLNYPDPDKPAPTYSSVGSVGVHSGTMRTRFDNVHVQSLPVMVEGIQTRSVTGDEPNRETGLRFGITTGISGAQYTGNTESPYEADYSAAEVVLGGTTYSVVKAGAVVTNVSTGIADSALVVGSTQENVKTVPAKKLSSVEGMAEYVVTVVSISEEHWGAQFRVRPYVTYRNGSEEKTVYGAVMTRCVNDRLA